jgi:hypothetical protein
VKFNPPLLTQGPLTDKVYVVTHGRIDPHPNIPDRTIVTASRKYDVTDQFNDIVAERIKDPQWKVDLLSGWLAKSNY